MCRTYIYPCGQVMYPSVLVIFLLPCSDAINTLLRGPIYSPVRWFYIYTSVYISHMYVYKYPCALVLYLSRELFLYLSVFCRSYIYPCELNLHLSLVAASISIPVCAGLISIPMCWSYSIYFLCKSYIWPYEQVLCIYASMQVLYTYCIFLSVCPIFVCPSMS
jgi:hypothetical protein